MPVGGNCDIEFRVDSAKFSHELDHAFAKQRLAARDPDLRDPERNQHTRHPQIIFEWQIAVERALIAGAAIDTLVIATIGDGDPQVSNSAAEFVV